MINTPTGCLMIEIDKLVFYDKNPKNHNKKDIELIIKSIKRNGWGDPILVCPETMEVLSGNGRLMAAKELGMEQVPCVYAPRGLTEKQKADLVIASNKLVEASDYNDYLSELIEEYGLDADDFGIEISEFDNKPKMPKEKEIPQGYEVVVECETEDEQQQVFEMLTERGYKCRILTL